MQGLPLGGPSRNPTIGLQWAPAEHFDMYTCQSAPRALTQEEKWIYLYAVRTRKSAGFMMRKLSVTESQSIAQFFGTSSRRKCRTARQKSL